MKNAPTTSLLIVMVFLHLIPLHSLHISEQCIQSESNFTAHLNTTFNCEDFNQFSPSSLQSNFSSNILTILDNWQTRCADLQYTNIGSQNGGNDIYLRSFDRGCSDASSWAFNSIDYVGDWSNAGSCLCFDFRIFKGGGQNSTPSPLYIYSGASDPFNATYRAVFRPTNSILISDEWVTLCPPISLSSNGELPSNESGRWEMSPASGTAQDWDNLISNVSGIAFAIDITSSPTEEFGYDNICLDTCPSMPCSIMAGTIEGGPFNFCINDGQDDKIKSGEVVLHGFNEGKSIWVLTDTLNSILAIENSYEAINFEDLHSGRCYLQHLTYTNELLNLALGNYLDELVGCYALSNSILIDKTDDYKECFEIIGNDFCPAPNGLKAVKINNTTYRISWNRGPSNFSYFEVVVGFKQEPNSFVTIPYRRNTILISASWSKTIEIKVRTKCSWTNVSAFSDTIELGTMDTRSKKYQRNEAKEVQYGQFTVIEEMFEISPNPSSDFISLSHSFIEPDTRFSIIDIRGSEILSSNLTNKNLKERINIKELQNGLYNIVISIDGRIVGQKQFLKIE